MRSLLDRWIEASPGGDSLFQVPPVTILRIVVAGYHDDNVFQRRISTEFFQCFGSSGERACKVEEVGVDCLNK